jgi:ADP-ribosylglycohydrolase
MNNVTLRDKFFGCIAGVHIGSSMGAAVEGWNYDRIESTYGTVDRLLSYEHYGNGWKREPGTTEDGVERQKLMITAIMKKQGRVTAEDVRAAWVSEIKPISIGMVSEPFEAVLLAMAKSGIPARDIGRYCDYAGLNSMARACHPIGLINAGDVKAAAEDILEVGQLYQTTNSRGLKWAMVTGVAIAEATKANATVDSVLGAIFDNCDPDIVLKELDRELKHTENCKDFRELRKAFDTEYNGYGMPYSASSANEVVTKAVCIFRMVKGITKDAIIAGVNLGRDTDCLAAVSSGISGALTGGSSIPKEWVEQVDKAAKLNIYTNTQRTIQENSDCVYFAYKEKLAKMQNLINEMGEL